MNFSFEKKLFLQGYRLIGGIDEAGRGPLAGPVVAVCVVAGQDWEAPEWAKAIRDSKKLSEKKREDLFEKIQAGFAGVGVGIINHETIDRVNILEATFLAMKQAVSALKIKPDLVLVDGKFPISNSSLNQQAIIGGDNQVLLIAAASIIAKVTRDRLMKEYDALYPEYGFQKHKGYGTVFHLAALRQHGPCPIHRLSFGGVLG